MSSSAKLFNNLILGNGNWRQDEAWIILVVGGVKWTLLPKEFYSDSPRGRGLNSQPFDWEAGTLPLSYCQPNFSALSQSLWIKVDRFKRGGGLTCTSLENRAAIVVALFFVRWRFKTVLVSQMTAQSYLQWKSQRLPVATTVLSRWLSSFLSWASSGRAKQQLDNNLSCLGASHFYIWDGRLWLLMMAWFWVVGMVELPSIGLKILKHHHFQTMMALK